MLDSFVQQHHEMLNFVLTDMHIQLIVASLHNDREHGGHPQQRTHGGTPTVSSRGHCKIAQRRELCTTTVMTQSNLSHSICACRTNLPRLNVKSCCHPLCRVVQAAALSLAPIVDDASPPETESMPKYADDLTIVLSQTSCWAPSYTNPNF